MKKRAHEWEYWARLFIESHQSVQTQSISSNSSGLFGQSNKKHDFWNWKKKKFVASSWPGMNWKRPPTGLDWGWVLKEKVKLRNQFSSWRASEWDREETRLETQHVSPTRLPPGPPKYWMKKLTRVWLFGRWNCDLMERESSWERRENLFLFYTLRNAESTRDSRVSCLDCFQKKLSSISTTCHLESVLPTAGSLLAS